MREMARLYPGELRASCGNNAWLFRLVHRLRQEDTRWGLNWKRSRVGDMSQDAITYNYGPEADEGTRFVHVVDVIGGHCGGNPGGAWIDQTILWTDRRRPGRCSHTSPPATRSRPASRPGSPEAPAGRFDGFPARNCDSAVVRCIGLAGRLPARSARTARVSLVAPFALADW